MQPGRSLPTGTVTFLFSEIEESARLWERDPHAMESAVARHDAIAAPILARHHGWLLKSRGESDSLMAVFARAADALAGAADLQRALLAEPWPERAPLRARIALHSGAADLRDGDYYGADVNRCARLRAAAHGGQILLSQAARDRVVDALPPGLRLRDLGLHRLRDLQQPERVFQVLGPGLPGDFPLLRSLQAFHHNLPATLTRFIGREEEIAAVTRLLAASRLVTLTGAGGCGKTRLALQVASGLLEQYPDGVRLAELAALSSPASVPQAVAAALGVREDADRPLPAALAEHLRERRLLLVLDNCEHLLPACAQLAALLLSHCPDLRILATSREPLAIAAEESYRVPSLATPDPDALPELERLRRSDAIRLFTDRALLGQPGFALTEANAAVVAQICRRLDGIPLALELAAARLKYLSVEQLAERLDDRFRLLTGGSRTALPRQQTLARTIEWSYDLLTEPERVLLRRLSVFAGGWDLEAAEAVCADDVLRSAYRVVGDAASSPTQYALHNSDVLDLLPALVEKSLAEHDAAEGRYRLLESVRQYARERLAATGEETAMLHRHREWLAALAERAEPALFGREQQQWLRRLDTERDNLREALLWSREANDIEPALRLAGALWWYWLLRGRWQEARELVEPLLARCEPGSGSSGRARALLAAGALARLQAESEGAARLLEESLALGRALGLGLHVARSLLQLGALAVGQEAYDRAGQLCEEALAQFRTEGDPWGTARALGLLGRVAADQGEYERATALLEESLSHFRALEDRTSIGDSLWRLGVTAARQGAFRHALAMHAESLSLYRDVGDRLGTARALCLLGHAAATLGEHRRAAERLEEGCREFRDLGSARTLAWAVDLAGLAAEQGEEPEKAAARFEESLALYREASDRRGIVRALHHLGRAAGRVGQEEQAVALLEESLALAQAMGPPRGIEARLGLAECRQDLGELFARTGRVEEAAPLLRESLAEYRALGEQGGFEARRGTARCLAALAPVALARGQAARAARLLAAAAALQEALGVPLPSPERADDPERTGAVRAALGDAAFATAWAEGTAMTPEQAADA